MVSDVVAVVKEDGSGDMAALFSQFMEFSKMMKVKGK